MPKHATNSALVSPPKRNGVQRPRVRIYFHENHSHFCLIYFHPPPFPALTSRGRVGNSLPSRPRPSHLAHSRSLALTHAALTHSLALARAGRRRVGCVNKNSQNKQSNSFRAAENKWRCKQIRISCSALDAKTGQTYPVCRRHHGSTVINSQLPGLLSSRLAERICVLAPRSRLSCGRIRRCAKM